MIKKWLCGDKDALSRSYVQISDSGQVLQFTLLLSSVNLVLTAMFHGSFNAFKSSRAKHVVVFGYDAKYVKINGFNDSTY
nr:hypothetical transcript [Hymenolepis microstoma]